MLSIGAVQISARKLNKTIEKQIFQILYQLVADTKTAEEAETLMADLLSGAERLAVAKRLAIAAFLDKGRSYENIRETLKVSSATIASVQGVMGNQGTQLALTKVKAGEWAEEWGDKIVNMFRSVVGKK